MQLATYKLGDKTYNVDDRLRELRNVENPHDAIRFGNEANWSIFLHCNDDLREIVEKQQDKREKIFGQRM